MLWLRNNIIVTSQKTKSYSSYYQTAA